MSKATIPGYTINGNGTVTGIEGVLLDLHLVEQDIERGREFVADYADDAALDALIDEAILLLSRPYVQGIEYAVTYRSSYGTRCCGIVTSRSNGVWDIEDAIEAYGIRGDQVILIEAL